MSRTEELIEEGTAALRVGDGVAAQRAFEAVLAVARSALALEGAARAEYLGHDYRRAVDLWGSADEAYRTEGDGIGAIRIARTLAFMYLSIIGDRAVMQGWFALERP